MAFEGTLETMAVADLLQWAANGRKTGTIRLSRSDVAKELFIEDGIIVSCSSTDPHEFLGHYLIRHGVLEEKQLQDALISQEESGDLLGQILVERDLITEDTLKEMLRLKAEEAIFDLFTWQEGRFRFAEGELPSHELVPISLGVQGLVLEGVRRLDEWQRINEVIPSELCVPVAVGQMVTPDGENDAGRTSVLEAVNDDRSVEEICFETHASRFFVCETLLRAHQEGRLKVVRPRTASTVREAREETSGLSLLESAKKHLLAGELERCACCFRAATTLEPRNRDLVAAAGEIEVQVRERLAGDGIVGGAIPESKVEIEKMAELSLEPSEGFILSRVDGATTVQAIVKISPLPEIDALLVIWRLVCEGHLSLR